MLEFTLPETSALAFICGNRVDDEVEIGSTGLLVDEELISVDTVEEFNSDFRFLRFTNSNFNFR
jgi:hypothetical protein